MIRIYVSDVQDLMESTRTLASGNFPRGSTMICTMGLCGQASWSHDVGFWNPTWMTFSARAVAGALAS